MFAFTLASLAALPVVFSLPRPRQTTPAWCEGLGPASFDTQYDFTLSAYNVSSSGEESSTGVSLIVAQYSQGSGPTYDGVLVTSSSYSPNIFPSFNLTQGALVPVSSQDYYTAATESSGVPTFIWSADSADVGASSQIYCGVANTDPAGGGNPCPQLAIDNDLDDFYLCANELGESELVHSPNAASSEQYPSYDPDSCYLVNVHIEDIYCGA